MICNPEEAVKLGFSTVRMPRPASKGGGAGETWNRWRGTSSCGWESASVGTQEQALGWARQHADRRHDKQTIPCPAGKHVRNREGACRRCNDGRPELSPEELLAALDFG